MSKTGREEIGYRAEFERNNYGIPSALALAQAFADADVLDDCDVSPVKAMRPGKAYFYVDDGTWEYEVTVHRTGRVEDIPDAMALRP